MRTLCTAVTDGGRPNHRRHAEVEARPSGHGGSVGGPGAGGRSTGRSDAPDWDGGAAGGDATIVPVRRYAGGGVRRGRGRDRGAARAAVPDGYVLYDEGTTRPIAADEVAEALENLRKALIAARLNKTTLAYHDPDPFIRNLTRGAWDTWYDPYFRGGPWNDLWDSPELANVATMLAADTRLATEPRVAGRITYQRSTEPDPVRGRPYRVLRFVTRFVWVYAFAEPPSLVVIRDVVSWQVPTDDRLTDWYVNQGLHLNAWEARAWGVECEAYEEGVVRPGNDVPITEAVFDLDREPAGGCRPG